MPKASEVAAELRKLADGMDRDPTAAVEKPYIFFTHYGTSDKGKFLNLAKAFPRPLTKEYRDTELRLEYKVAAIDITAKINRDAVCRIVEPATPAVYECEPILSAEEEYQLGGAQ